jgi:hypothetical protein
VDTPVKTSVAAAPSTPAPVPQMDLEALEKAVKAVLAKNKAAEAANSAVPAPRAVDWSKVTEKDITNALIDIPVIEHEIPDYMNMMLKDQEYVAVWASKDQRRIGQLKAEGYEFLKPEHVHPDFKLPLIFDSEGLYRYVDVVCMRVHKRILFGKRKRALLLSIQQLKNTKRPPRAKVKNAYKLEDPILLDPQIGPDYYDTEEVEA